MYLGLILRGMGVACISATKFGMIADSIEYGEYKTGTRAEGFVYSAASLGVRVGSALASAVIGWYWELMDMTASWQCRVKLQ